MTIPVLPGVVKLLPQKSKVEKKKVDCVHCGEKVIEDFMKYHLSSASCKWKREQKDKSNKTRESSANSSLSEETFFDGLANMFKEDKSKEGKKDLKSSDVHQLVDDCHIVLCVSQIAICWKISISTPSDLHKSAR